MSGRGFHPPYVVKWRTRLRPCVMRWEAAISRGCAAHQMSWSAACSASARKFTVSLEQLRAIQQLVQEQPAQHLVAILGPSRVSTAKSRQVLMLVLERPHIPGALSRETKASLRSGSHPARGNLLLDGVSQKEFLSGIR